MLKKKLAFLLSVMLVFSVVGYAVCAAAGPKQISEKEGETMVVSSFYPMYILTKNLLAESESVTVQNLTESQTGCLHDYQLTTGDMKLLAEAEAFVINGAGMELFMERILSELKELPVIEASAGIELLAETGHTHEHEKTETEHEVEADRAEDSGQFEDADHAESDAHAHEHEENGHVWMDVERYREQAVNVCTELVTLFPEEKDAILSAWKAYDAKLLTLSAEVEELREETEGIYVVSFHDAFVYLADSLGMEVIAVLALDEETVPSAGEIAEVIEEIHHHGETWILIEEAYASHAEKIVKETGAKVLYLDPLVTGEEDADGYLTGMQRNLEKIKKESSDGKVLETTE